MFWIGSKVKSPIAYSYFTDNLKQKVRRCEDSVYLATFLVPGKRLANYMYMKQITNLYHLWCSLLWRGGAILNYAP